MKKSAVLFLILMITAFAVAEDAEMKFAATFELPGTDGEQHTLNDYKDAKGVVVMFIATRCPVSNGFNERMVELANAYQERGIVFLGINSNKMEDMAEVKEHANKHDFPFVVLKDINNEVADKYDAKVTPEVYLLNSDLEIVYHGRIDDSADADERKSTDLTDALDELLAGEKITTAQTKAFGCSIKRTS